MNNSEILIQYKQRVNYPNHTRASEKLNHVYLFWNKDNFTFKIGVSGNPFNRLRQVQLSSGMSLEYVIILKLQEGYDECPKIIEKYLHEYFKIKRTIGEWFNLSIKDIFLIRDLFYEIDGEYIYDNLSRYQREKEIARKRKLSLLKA